MREMPEVRHPLPLSNSGFQELIHVLWQACDRDWARQDGEGQALPVLVALRSTTQVHNAAF